MKERAEVLEVKKDTIMLRVDPAEACSKCCRCGASRARTICLKKEEYQNVKKGDMVEIEVKSSRMMKVYVLLYGVPLIVFSGSTIIIYLVAESPLLSFIGAIILTALSFLVSGYFIKRDAGIFPAICRKNTD